MNQDKDEVRNQEKFTLDMRVRDYECDMQGIVNNAVYQHYLEHARHRFLAHSGLSFSELTRAGVIIVMVRAEIDYRGSLRADDSFTVSVQTSRPTPLRLQFEQEIWRPGESKILVRACITTTAVNERGRPYFPASLSVLTGPDEGVRGRGKS